MITEPGPNLIIADNKDTIKIDSILHRINISIDVHKSKRIVIVGHTDCAGNPNSDDKQIEQLLLSKNSLLKLYPQVEVFALWVNSNFEVEEIK